MLSMRENVLNLWCIQFLSKLCFIPVEINTKSGQIRITRGRVWGVFMMAAKCHILFCLSRIIIRFRTVDFQEFISRFTLHYFVVFGNMVCCFISARYFLVCPEITTCLFNNCMSDNRHVATLQRKSRARGGERLEKTYLDILTKVMPLCVFPVIILIFFTITKKITRPIVQDLHWILQVAAILGDAVVLWSWGSWAYFFMLLQLLFIGKVKFILNREMNSTLLETGGGRRNMYEVTRAFKTLRTLQMEVAFFNESNAPLIFAFKVIAAGGVILCGFAAVQFFRARSLLTYLNASVVVDSTFIFGVLYARGFTIPRDFGYLKIHLRKQVRLHACVEDKLILERCLRSIRPVSIKVGFFHTLERLSTPNFIDFCVKNSVRAIIAYRR